MYNLMDHFMNKALGRRAATSLKVVEGSKPPETEKAPESPRPDLSVVPFDAEGARAHEDETREYRLWYANMFLGKNR